MSGQETMGEPRTPAIEVERVTVHYGEVLALDEVELRIASGRVCGLIGMNGSGKSTLFKTIMGLIQPDAGTVRIDGGDPTLARKRSAIGYMPQSEDVDWSFPVSVRDVVSMGRYGREGPMRRASAADRAAVADALERVGLTDLAGRQIGQLSGGQRKRAFLARVIAQEADVLLLDEPFAGVDKRSEALIVQLLRSLAASGCAVLVSTHDLGALGELADEAVLLNRRILLHGSVEAVLRPDNLARAFGLGGEAADGAENRTAGEADA